MKYCTACGAKGYDHEQYCTQCGAPFMTEQPHCPYCGVMIKSWGATTCPQCGGAINLNSYPSNISLHECEHCHKGIPYHSKHCPYCGQEVADADDFEGAVPLFAKTSISSTEDTTSSKILPITVILIVVISVVVTVFPALIHLLSGAFMFNVHSDDISASTSVSSAATTTVSEVVTTTTTTDDGVPAGEPVDVTYTAISMEELAQKYYAGEVHVGEFYEITGTVSKLSSLGAEISCTNLTAENRNFTLEFESKNYELGRHIKDEILAKYKEGDTITVRCCVSTVWQYTDSVWVTAYGLND